MVNAVYDHIIAILVVGSIFVSAVVMLPGMSFMNLQVVDQQQLRNTALNVFNAMLLDSGEPLDWGSMDPFCMNDPRVKRFGLASAQESAFYVLDPDKVQRLVLDNPLNYIEYDRLRELLQLQGYGFKFRIIPPFNVTNLDGSSLTNKSPITIIGQELNYAIKVTYLHGAPIPNALVKTTLIYTDGLNLAIITRILVQTDALGICRDTTTLKFEPKHVIAVLRVTVANVATLVVTFSNLATWPNDIAKINFVGDTIIRTTPDPTPIDARWVDSIMPVYSNENVEFLYNGTRRNNDKLNYGSFRVWQKDFRGLRNLNPTVFVFSFWAVIKGEGRREVLVAGPYQNLMGYTIFEYGVSPKSESVALQRSVIISDMTYTAELILWKE